MRVRRCGVLLAMCAVLLAGACGGGSGPGTGAGTGPGSGGGPAGDGYAVTVRTGAAAERFDAARLNGLPAVSVQTPRSGGETTQTGPSLVSVLTSANAAGYRTVRVVGPSESVTLAAGEVRPDLLLATTRRGTVKLAGPGLDPSRWVRDVTDVEVTP
ncbi:hypothetical protein [Pseudonocardia sp. KRD291]|uniref:hypothetical protein n=1 Tax=Pseudonocardia sp. KRD291 TaxID=2792007 RepID=UPI001C4A3393|nr:hypothetical protein [Pseudonocardia sp. KRD291]MBW0102560.1 hypothetical protein [Pseudonocardia sp. KRD291]